MNFLKKGSLSHQGDSSKLLGVPAPKMIKPVIWSAQFHLIFHENLTLSICQVQTKNPSQCVYSEFLTHSIIAGAHLSVCRAPFPLLLFQESWWWGAGPKERKPEQTARGNRVCALLSRWRYKLTHNHTFGSLSNDIWHIFRRAYLPHCFLPSLASEKNGVHGSFPSPVCFPSLPQLILVRDSFYFMSREKKSCKKRKTPHRQP